MKLNSEDGPYRRAGAATRARPSRSCSTRLSPRARRERRRDSLALNHPIAYVGRHELAEDLQPLLGRDLPREDGGQDLGFQEPQVLGSIDLERPQDERTRGDLAVRTLRAELMDRRERGVRHAGAARVLGAASPL